MQLYVRIVEILENEISCKKSHHMLGSGSMVIILSPDLVVAILCSFTPGINLKRVNLVTGSIFYLYATFSYLVAIMLRTTVLSTPASIYVGIQVIKVSMSAILFACLFCY